MVSPQMDPTPNITKIYCPLTPDLTDLIGVLDSTGYWWWLAMDHTIHEPVGVISTNATPEQITAIQRAIRLLTV